MALYKEGPRFIYLGVGILLSILLLEVLLSLGGFIFSSLQKSKSSLKSDKDNYIILALGESTTLMGGKNYSWPTQLEQILNEMGYGKFTVINEGISGANSTVILSHLDENLSKYNPDIVIAMMGLNDKYISEGADEGYVPSDLQPLDSPIVSFLKKSKTYKLIRFLLINGGKRLEELKTSRKLTVYAQSSSEKLLKKAIEENPKNDTAYLELANLYREENRFFEAVEMYKKAIEVNPRNEQAYLELGHLLRNHKDQFKEAEEMLLRLKEINSKNETLYLELGALYRQMQEDKLAETVYKEAIALNPNNELFYINFADFYGQAGGLEKAAEMYKKAIEVNPRNGDGYTGLGHLYKSTGALSESEIMYRKAIELNPNNPDLYIGLATLYRQLGKSEEARAMDKKVLELLPVLNFNYRKLKEALKERGIKLVAVQYPLRSVETLKEILGHDPEVIYVDNEKIFREALNQRSYSDYFVDRFAGDFGHATPKGNRLLAENIADTLIKELFAENKN